MKQYNMTVAQFKERLKTWDFFNATHDVTFIDPETPIRMYYGDKPTPFYSEDEYPEMTKTVGKKLNEDVKRAKKYGKKVPYKTLLEVNFSEYLDAFEATNNYIDFSKMIGLSMSTGRKIYMELKNYVK